MIQHGTVFVVDDDPGIRRSLKALGQARGLTVEAYASSRAFLKAYDSERPGCLLLDVRLAGRSGLDLQDELRRRGALLPIIVLTGHGDVPTSVRAFRTGAVDFVEKPVRPRVLIRRIHEAMAIDRERRQAASERKELAKRMARLTRRERQVASLLAEGKSSKEVAGSLGISIRTVEGHRHHLLEKMEIHSVVVLATVLGKLRPAIDAGSRPRPMRARRVT